MSPTACGASVGKTDGWCTPIDSYGVHPYDALCFHAFIHLQCSCLKVAKLNLPPVQPLRSLLITVSKVLYFLNCWGHCPTYLTVNPYVWRPFHHPSPVNCHLQDCKLLLVASCVSSDRASVQTFPVCLSLLQVGVVDGRARRLWWRRTSTRKKKSTATSRKLVRNSFTASLRRLSAHSSTSWQRYATVWWLL